MSWSIHYTDHNLDCYEVETGEPAKNEARQLLHDFTSERLVPADDRGRGWRVWWFEGGFIQATGAK